MDLPTLQYAANIIPERTIDYVQNHTHIHTKISVKRFVPKHPIRRKCRRENFFPFERVTAVKSTPFKLNKN